MNVNRLARVYAALAGAADLGTGIGLVFLPGPVLALMGVAPVTGEALVFLRWVGAFVGAVGASYFWALWRPAMGLRAMLELTILFRVAAGLFSAWAIATGGLTAAWWSVPVTDLGLVAVQVWLLRKGAGRDG